MKQSTLKSFHIKPFLRDCKLKSCASVTPNPDLIELSRIEVVEKSKETRNTMVISTDWWSHM